MTYVFGIGRRAAPVPRPPCQSAIARGATDAPEWRRASDEGIFLNRMPWSG